MNGIVFIHLNNDSMLIIRLRAAGCPPLTMLTHRVRLTTASQANNEATMKPDAVGIAGIIIFKE